MNLKYLVLAYVFIHLVYQTPALAQLFSYQTKSEQNVETLVESLQKGDILVLGESHSNDSHHANHIEIFNELLAQEITFDLGMELFYDYRKQFWVDQYLRDEVSEDEFLINMNWMSSNYADYRPKVLAPLEVAGWTYALNAPKELTGFVTDNGLQSLPKQLQDLMPPAFELGSDSYYQRFLQAVKDHFPPEKINNAFASQSIWDETMAWQALHRQQQSNSDIFVIVVGNFHSNFGDGLPARLLARGAQRVVTVSQVDTSKMNKEEKSAIITDDPKWGKRADWIWLTQ